MKSIKSFFWCSLLLMISNVGFAQKQNFDVISYAMPKGWEQQENEGGLQLSINDKKSGAYAIAVITRATASKVSANENFNNEWIKLVKGTVQVNNEPTMSAPTNENGWEIISGGANYTDGGNTGMVTLLTATGGTQMLSVVLMTNTKQYQNHMLAFLNSLELTKAPSNVVVNANTSTINHANSSSIVGLWCDNLLETSGYANGFPQYTAGYFRREYLFKEDGTYIFRTKNWSVWTKDILFVYESGTYVVQGNQVTVVPDQGRGEWWSKKDNKTTLWGNRLRGSDFKLEKISYTFEIKYYSGSKDYVLSLNPNKTTQRDGTYSNQNGFLYTARNIGESPIDYPPGFKAGSENKSLLSSNVPSQTDNVRKGDDINSQLAGKTWQAYSVEKFPSSYAATSGFNTGGFWFWQYKFNKDGTYQFVYNGASALAVNPVNVLQYETGTYSVNGDQLTITPIKGSNEEWSVGKVNNGMSETHIREVLENRLKRLKTQTRKLEKITYPFKVEYWEGNKENALMLQHIRNTEREGSPGANNYSSFFETQPGKLSHLLPKEN